MTDCVNGRERRIPVTIQPDEIHIAMNAIEQSAALREQVANLTAERYAAIADISVAAFSAEVFPCEVCASDGLGRMGYPCNVCTKKHSAFQWRGLCADNAPSSAGEAKPDEKPDL